MPAASGCAWMGIDSEAFYDPQSVALLPMGFCFPGSGPSGDLPPRPECATTWREKVLGQLGNITLTLVIGQYAQRYHLSGSLATVTGVVAAWRDHWPDVVPLPHPSPRNNMWLRRNPWFEDDLCRPFANWSMGSYQLGRRPRETEGGRIHRRHSTRGSPAAPRLGRP